MLEVPALWPLKVANALSVYDAVYLEACAEMQRRIASNGCSALRRAYGSSSASECRRGRF